VGEEGCIILITLKGPRRSGSCVKVQLIAQRSAQTINQSVLLKKCLFGYQATSKNAVWARREVIERREKLQ
jgi:hypothetical protein